MYVIETCTDNLQSVGPAGKQTVVRTICAELENRGLAFEIMIPHSDPIRLGALRVLAIPMEKINYEAGYMWRLKAAYNTLRSLGARRLLTLGRHADHADVIVHAHDFVSAAAFLCLKHDFPSVSVMMTNHSAGLQVGSRLGQSRDGRRLLRPTRHGRLLYKWEYDTLMHVDRIVFVSSFARREALKLHPDLEANSTVVHNASALPVSCMRVLSRITPRVCFIGRLSKEKGPDIYLDVASRVSASMLSTEFYIAGSGRLDGWVRDELKRRSLASVSLLGFQSDIRALFQRIDVCAITSRIEAFSMVAVEAMASGVPVVAFDVGGISEVLGENYYGLCNPEDTDQMAEKILQICSDAALYSELSARLLQRARMFSSTSMMDRYIEVMSEMREAGRD